MDKDTIRETAPVAGARFDSEYLPEIPRDPNEYRAMGCRSCGLPRVFRRRRINHSLHLLLAIGTLGGWLPVWGIIILLQALKPWNCTVCGVHQRHN